MENINPIIENSLIVPVHCDRADYKNLACGLFNVNTGEYVHGRLGSDKAIQIKESIKNKKATVVYVHSKLNVYGIIKDSKKAIKPALYWISGEQAEIIKDKLINYEEKLNTIDISDEPIEVFKGKYRADLFSITRITDNKLGKIISYEEFSKSLTKEQVSEEQEQVSEEQLIATDIKEVQSEYHEETASNNIYELILKVMKIDDSISLPRDFYDNLITIIKRNMMISKSGTKYDSIVLIKIDRASKENLVARVEYDITKDYTRVTIIKQYDSNELTDNQLVDYEIKFNQWRRMHSYRTSE